MTPTRRPSRRRSSSIPSTPGSIATNSFLVPASGGEGGDHAVGRLMTTVGADSLPAPRQMGATWSMRAARSARHRSQNTSLLMPSWSPTVATTRDGSWSPRTSVMRVSSRSRRERRRFRRWVGTTPILEQPHRTSSRRLPAWRIPSPAMWSHASGEVLQVDGAALPLGVQIVASVLASCEPCL